MATNRKKYRRRRRPAAAPKRMTSKQRVTAFLDSILAGIISGLMVLALQKLFHW